MILLKKKREKLKIYEEMFTMVYKFKFLEIINSNLDFMFKIKYIMTKKLE
jgi:hypothetical protein